VYKSDGKVWRGNAMPACLGVSGIFDLLCYKREDL